jgi:DNA-binding MarR family transcriptional regulator
MRSANEHQEPIEGSSYRELQLLTEVDADPQVTQRQLSRRVGIALGLTNTLLRNLTQKGYVRATRASWKSWLYSLTPEGFTRKIRLTVAYVQRFVDHYQRVRQTLREQLDPLALNEESRIAIYGTGELAELVYLGLKEIGIEEIDVFGPNGLEGHRFLGMPVQDLEALRPERYDRVLLALLQGWEAPHGDLRDRGAAPEKLVTFFGDNRVREKV